MRLGIIGLPQHLDRLRRGELYTCSFDTGAARLGLTLTLLRANRGAGVSAALVSGQAPRETIARLRALGADDLVSDIRSGALALFCPSSELAGHVLRGGGEQLGRALNAAGVEQNAIVVFESADALFPANDPAFAASQAAAFRSWCQRHGITAFFMFLSSAQESVRAVGAAGGGLATVCTTSDGSELGFDCWAGADAFTADGGFHLSVYPGEHVPTARARDGLRRTPADEAEQPLVLHNGVDLPRGFDYGLHWQFHGRLADLCEHAQREPAATVLLTQEEDLPAFAEQIFLIRRVLHSGAHVIARQGRRRCRLSGIALLHEVGASRVVAASESPARLAVGLKTLRAQRWRGGKGPFSETVASALPEVAGGRVQPSVFCERAARLLGHSSHLGVPCLLVRVVGDAVHRLLEQADGVVRRSDLSTLSGSTLWLFFYACEAEQEATVVERVLCAHESSHFERRCYRAAGAIEAALEELRSACAERGKHPDLRVLTVEASTDAAVGAERRSVPVAAGPAKPATDG
jgi:hypothetical protein